MAYPAWIADPVGVRQRLAARACKRWPQLTGIIPQEAPRLRLRATPPPICGVTWVIRVCYRRQEMLSEHRTGRGETRSAVLPSHQKREEEQFTIADPS